MSYNSEARTIEIYSFLLNKKVPKDDKYWSLFFETPFHYVSLNSTFENLSARQIVADAGILGEIFRQCLTRLDQPNSLSILRIFVKNVMAKNYGHGKNDIIFRIFGDLDQLEKNFVTLLVALKKNLSPDSADRLKFSSFKLFATAVKSFYNTIVFEFFYQVDLNDELLDIFLIDNLEFEVIGELLVTLSILEGTPLISSNIYKNRLAAVFEREQVLSNINYQLKQFLTFGISFYHGLKPDLLNKKEQHSTFYNWVTFNRYNTKVKGFADFLKANIEDEDLMQYIEVKRDRFEKKHELVKEMLPVIMFLHSLIINNDDYCGLFTTRFASGSEIDLLEAFLSFASFVVQFSNTYNVMISRLTFLVLYRLVSKQGDNLSEYYIDQYKVKPCYQRHPIVSPVGEIEYLVEDNSGVENEMVKNKNSLYYILDVIQCQMRFNLSKKLDLIQYKLSTAIILKLIPELNYHSNYNWHDFLKTIFQTLAFLVKSFTNDDKISALVEELVIIIELLIVNFHSEREFRKFEMVEITYKILENHERLLFLKGYQQGNLPNLTIILNLVMTNFLNKIDMNYNEIYGQIEKYIEEDEEFQIVATNDLHGKITRADLIFENSETFKYLYQGEISNNNKISMINKSIEQLTDDYKIFY